MLWAVLMLVSMVSGSQAAVSSSSAAHKKTPPTSGPGCETTRDKEDVTITCSYQTDPSSASSRTGSSRTGDSKSPGDVTVAVKRAVFSFEPTDSSNMEAELTFTNVGAKAIAEARAVYLEIDDDSGNNYVRRELPSVDFRKLRPGQSLTFSETLRIAAFVPGHYRISLWIPDPDKSRMFKPANNALLANSGDPASATRLNTLADFTVAGFRH